MTIFLLILGLLLFIGLVVIHELGHFFIARRNGVVVEEFGIGFPPRIWSKKIKKGGYTFSINWLPLGGFVKLKGEHDADTEPGTFGAASLWTKTKIMLAGVTINFLAALVILSLTALIGVPKLLTKDSVGQNQFSVTRDTKIIFDNRQVTVFEVESGSPAANAGLQVGDQIVSLGRPDKPIRIVDAETLIQTTHSFAGQKIDLEYLHGIALHKTQVQLRTTEEINSNSTSSHPKGYLGVVPNPSGYVVQRSTWSAPIVAVGLSIQITRLTLSGLWSAVKGLGSLVAGAVTRNTVARQAGQAEATRQVGGPVAIFFALKDGASQGINFILFIIGFISLSLAIINLLPIPAFDGGRLYLMLFSRKLLRKPLSQKMEERIVGASFILLLVLVVLITIVDIKRPH